MTSQVTHEPDVVRGPWFRIAWLLLPVLSVVYQVFAKQTAGALNGLTIDLAWIQGLLHLRTFWLMVGFSILTMSSTSSPKFTLVWTTCDFPA